MEKSSRKWGNNEVHRAKRRPQFILCSEVNPNSLELWVEDFQSRHKVKFVQFS